jgi:hypothetical protein
MAQERRPRSIAGGASVAAQTLQYSLEVHGWEFREGDTVRGLRSIRLVAASHDEAVKRARALLDPAGKYPDDHWAVVAGGEISPEEAKAWAKWHRETVSNEG